MTDKRPGADNDDLIADGADTLVDVLQQAATDGYTAQLIAKPDGTVECPACRSSMAASELDVQGMRRLEGASDVADSLLVLFARCRQCGIAGTLILGYGPNASDADLAVVPQIDLGHADPAAGI